MTARTMGGSALGRLRGISSNRAMAVVLWVLSTYTVSLLIEAMRSGSSIYALGNRADGVLGSAVGFLWGSSFLAAIVLQALTTVGERPIWRKQQTDIVAMIAVGVDIATNTAAVYPFTRNFDNTQIWTMIVDVSGVQNSFGPLASLVLALVVGIAMAAGPEKLWSRG